MSTAIDMNKASEKTLVRHAELLSPLSPDFHTSGDRETQKNSRRWALENHYLLVQGVPPCPHGFYGMTSCPGDCYGGAKLDHVDMWYGHEDHTLFLLSHPYATEIPEETASLAFYHGLDIDSWRLRDGWYSDHTIPIRLSVRNDFFVWPLEPRLIALATLIPAVWPAE